MNNFCVIGGGIVGSSIALEIQRKDLAQVIVLEKESGPGKHSSGRNSGVLHSGINLPPGSMKARMCVEGNKRARDFCRAYGVPMNECGTFVVARNSEEEQTLCKLLERGRENGVPGIQLLDRGEFRKIEPEIKAERVLFSPTGAVVDSGEFLRKIVNEAENAGAEFRFNTKVLGISEGIVHSSEGDFKTDHVINCAGLYADKIAHMAGVGNEYRVIPFRGEYMKVPLQVHSMVYQAPNLKFPFLGVHFTKSINDGVLAGPNSTISFGRESYRKEINYGETMDMLFSRNFLRMLTNKDFLKLAFENARTSFSNRAYLEQINSLLERPLALEDLAPYRSGIRAQLVNNRGKLVDDLVVYFNKDNTHILNAVSPGMTCALAFSEYIVDNIEERVGGIKRS